ncbi:MAG: polysaccharide deacetylase family protein [bacterium]
MKSKLLYASGWVLRQPLLSQAALGLSERLFQPPRQSQAVRNRRPAFFRILIYHRVVTRDEGLIIDGVTETDFRRHLEIIAKYFRVIPLEQLAQEVENDAVQKNTVCITFDDGYRDNYELAFPALQAYGLPATVFLATDFIGTGKILWHDQVLLAIRGTTRQQIEWPIATERKMILPLQYPAQRQQSAFQLLQMMKQLAPPQRDAQIAGLLEYTEVEPERASTRLMLDWDEVKQMDRQGISFGAHTLSHPILSLLNDEDVEEEVHGSKRTIEAKLGHSIGAFAYPNGKLKDFDQRVKRAVASAGFRCAVTTLPNINCIHTDAFAWGRSRPWENDPNRFFARLLMMRS